MKRQGWLMLGLSWLALTGCQTVKHRLDSFNRFSAANHRPSLSQHDDALQVRSGELVESSSDKTLSEKFDSDIKTVAYRPRVDDNLSPVRLEPPTPESQASVIGPPATELETLTPALATKSR
ncbi:MAG: hypothetical protein R3C28_28830 [Pirellulaceae bacterium]